MSKDIDFEDERRRNLELATLVLRVIVLPLIMIGNGIYIIFFVPDTNYSELKISAGFIIIFIGIVFNPMQGNEYLHILSRYINRLESQDDIISTKRLYIEALAIFLVLIAITLSVFQILKN